MRKHIDGAYIAAEIRLLRQRHKGAIMLIEGGTDARLLDKFLHSSAQTHVSYGKTYALEALQDLEDNGYRGVFAVLDADFDRILNIVYDCDSLFYCDTADLDTMLFKSAALDRYLGEFAEPNLFNREFSSVDEFRKAILKASAPLAVTRLSSERMKLNLKFKELKLDTFIDLKTLKLDEPPLFTKIIQESNNTIAVSALMEINAKSLAMVKDAWDLAHGHDVMTFTGVALRSLIGKRRETQTWDSEISSGLRLTFDQNDLRQTQLWASIKAWESGNVPFQVFA